MKLADEILTQLKAMLKSRWASFSAKERKILEGATLDAANLAVQTLSGAITPAKAKTEQAFITATVASLKSAGAAHLVEFFWSAVRLGVRGALAAATLV